VVVPPWLGRNSMNL